MTMSPLLPSVISNPRSQPFLLVQSSAAQSCFPIVRHIVGHSVEIATVLLFCLLYPPSALASRSQLESENLVAFDWLANVPGYSNSQLDTKTEILEALSYASELAVEFFREARFEPDPQLLRAR